MDEDEDELTIVVGAAVGASTLERHGMLRRLEQAVTGAIAEIATGGYLTQGIVDRDEVRLIIEAPKLASAQVLALIGDAVTALMADPDVWGWGPFSVAVTDETPSPDSSAERSPAVSPERTEPTPAGIPFDREEPRRRLLADAEHLAHGLDIARLTRLDPHAADPLQRARATTEARYVAGALFQAAVVAVDHLFIDLDTLKDGGEFATVASLGSGAFFVLDELPPRWAHRYELRFAQALLVATVDLTRRLTAGWEPPACVAQELILRVILNQAEAHLDAAEVRLDPGWRSAVEEVLCEDADHELLFEPAADGLEDEPETWAIPGTSPKTFTDWFRPLTAEWYLPPYLLDQSRTP